jgi:hypothetical protein
MKLSIEKITEWLELKIKREQQIYNEQAQAPYQDRDLLLKTVHTKRAYQAVLDQIIYQINRDILEENQQMEHE